MSPMMPASPSPRLARCAYRDWIDSHSSSPQIYPGAAPLLPLLRTYQTRQAAAWLEHWQAVTLGKARYSGHWTSGQPVHLVQVRRTLRVRGGLAFLANDRTLAVAAPEGHGEAQVAAFSLRRGEEVPLPRGTYRVLRTVQV